jgi:DNA-binding FrmR family transcriptional regulator
LPDQWKESIIVSVYKKGNKSDCSNYHGMSLLSASCNIFSNILLSVLSPYIDEITEDHQCGFRCNRSTTDQIFCIHQILEKKRDYNEIVHQLVIHFKKACNSVMREVLYNILIKFGVHMKLVMLIKIHLKETYSKVYMGKHFYDNFPIQGCLNKEIHNHRCFSILL